MQSMLSYKKNNIIYYMFINTYFVYKYEMNAINFTRIKSCINLITKSVWFVVFIIIKRKKKKIIDRRKFG